MKDLAKEIAKKGKQFGICDAFYTRLINQKPTKSQMCEYYLAGIDFCLEHNFPDNDFIQANFSGEMQKHGIFLNELVNVENRRVCVCLGECYGKITTTQCCVTRIHAKHDSDLTIVAKDNSFVMVDIYDDSNVTIYAHNRANVCVNNYGGTVKLNKFDNASIKYKDKTIKK